MLFNGIQSQIVPEMKEEENCYEFKKTNNNRDIGDGGSGHMIMNLRENIARELSSSDKVSDITMYCTI